MFAVMRKGSGACTASLSVSILLLALFAMQVAAMSDLECFANYRSCDQCKEDSGCVWCEDPKLQTSTKEAAVGGSCISGSWTGPSHNYFCVNNEDLCFTCGSDWRYGQCTMRSVILYSVVSVAFFLLLVIGGAIVYKCFCRSRGYTVIA
eukprot:Opistho-2@84932